MINSGNWYAIIKHSDDDWGTGDYDFAKAVELANLYDCDEIAEINEDVDKVCIKTYHKGKDF